MTFPADLVTVNRLARFASAPTGPEDLSDHGLILGDELQRLGYWCTPVNALTFASTGGDGVHFSLIDLGGPSEHSPVVMTVPMAVGDDLRQSWILGETIVEFLSLGLHGGYFSLEQLAYDPTWPAQLTERGSGARPAILDRLAAELDLTPWADVASRLDDLHERFSPALRLPPGD